MQAAFWLVKAAKGMQAAFWLVKAAKGMQAAFWLAKAAKRMQAAFWLVKAAKGMQAAFWFAETCVLDGLKQLGQNHSSGAAWESRWPSWAVHPNEPSGFRGHKAILNHASALVWACP